VIRDWCVSTPKARRAGYSVTLPGVCRAGAPPWLHTWGRTEHPENCINNFSSHSCAPWALLGMIAYHKWFLYSFRSNHVLRIIIEHPVCLMRSLLRITVEKLPALITSSQDNSRNTPCPLITSQDNRRNTSCPSISFQTARSLFHGKPKGNPKTLLTCLATPLHAISETF
jgi:hypothetical protein